MNPLEKRIEELEGYTLGSLWAITMLFDCVISLGGDDYGTVVMERLQNLHFPDAGGNQSVGASVFKNDLLDCLSAITKN